MSQWVPSAGVRDSPTGLIRRTSGAIFRLSRWNLSWWLIPCCALSLVMLSMTLLARADKVIE